ncbi:hypothetical protein E3N88_38035 [Mikania micrantha]|uniref:Uncharacterized protein n=1 Tax=Mikania micrantha TaxID=192012 RepID=A0A5N6LST2_9ASTR|nr:hypothetical protein E3N88_38035 [Mikania micrantha]
MLRLFRDRDLKGPVPMIKISLPSYMKRFPKGLKAGEGEKLELTWSPPMKSQPKRDESSMAPDVTLDSSQAIVTAVCRRKFDDFEDDDDEYLYGSL